MSNDTIGNGTARGLRAILQPPREDSPTTETILAGEANVVTNACLGVGIRRESTASTSPVIRIHRIEFLQLPTNNPATLVILR